MSKHRLGWVLGCAVVVALGSVAPAANVSFSLNPAFQAEQPISGSPSTGGTFEVKVGRTSAGAESRGVYEYALPALPAGSTLNSAGFDTGISSAQGGAGAFPDLSFHGYVGNGAFTASDALVPFNQIGRTGPMTTTGLRSDALNAAYIAGRINAGSSHLGLMVYNETLDRSAGISRGNLRTPVVTLNATVPNVGTVNARPVFDVKASSSNNTDYVLIEGETAINTQYVPSVNVDRRGIMEYHLGGVPDGAQITSAKIAFNISSLTTGSGDGPEIRLYGYGGNGTPELSDVNQTFTLLGTGNTVTSTGPGYEVSLSPALIQSMLAGGNDYVGILALGSADGRQFGFDTLEGGTPAVLSVAYAVPEPVAMTLLLLAPAALLVRRRRARA